MILPAFLDLTVIIMAAGIGSRYGGLKQAEGVGPKGQLILDYSLYDAFKAGFKKAVLVVRPEMEEALKERMHPAAFQNLSIDFAYQTTKLEAASNKPHSITRNKPWGTGQATLCAKPYAPGPFMVINADDYYGPQAFKLLAEFLKTKPSDSREGALIGYRLKNTLSSHGPVARAVCKVDSTNKLLSLEEHTKIEKNSKNQSEIIDTAIENSLTPLKGDDWVSLNCWGFMPCFWGILEEGFSEFLQKNSQSITAEYYLPVAVDNAIKDHQMTFSVLGTEETYTGLTYAQDRLEVAQYIKQQHEKGVYPPDF